MQTNLASKQACFVILFWCMHVNQRRPCAGGPLLQMKKQPEIHEWRDWLEPIATTHQISICDTNTNNNIFIKTHERCFDKDSLQRNGDNVPIFIVGSLPVRTVTSFFSGDNAQNVGYDFANKYLIWQRWYWHCRSMSTNNVQSRQIRWTMKIISRTILYRALIAEPRES